MRAEMLLILCLTLLAAGPQTIPASKPAEPPASTPKEALHSLNIAQRDGDSAAVRSLFTAEDERGSQLVVAMADYAAALVALHASADNAYGPEGANFMTGDMKTESEKGLAAIDKSVVTIEHESATVKYAGATDAPIRLVKIDGRWKLPVVQLLEGADKESEEKGIKELTHQALIARAMAEEIAAGKFKQGANSAREAWRARLLAPVTQPIKSSNTANPKSQPVNPK